MSLFTKGIVFIILVIVIYALWPRQPSLNKFNPEKLAEVETKAWQALVQGRRLSALAQYYLIYDLQYGFSPMRAFYLAQNRTGAVGKILRAADVADMEDNLPAMTEFYVIVKRDTSSPFDAATTARLDARVWTSVAQKSWGEPFINEIASLLGELHGVSTKQVTVAAKLRARALEKAFSGAPSAGDWNSVRSSLQQSYEALKKALATKTK
jgi:hypothetical protein